MWGCCRLAVVLISREEALGAQDGGQLRPQHLERDLAVVAEVVGQVDRRHPALPELALEAVAVGKSGRQMSEVLGHACSRVGCSLNRNCDESVVGTKVAQVRPRS